MGSHCVWVKKASHPYGHHQGYDNSGRLYCDMYAIRLAETYWLRAEVYLNKGDLVIWNVGEEETGRPGAWRNE